MQRSMKSRTVRRAIIPATGFGTAFLPATKAVPKEMLPLVDCPLIQYAVEEAFAAGIEEIVIVTGRGKCAIEDHFDHATELNDALHRDGARQALDAIERSEPRPGAIAYIRQPEPLGLGHALWCARYVIGNEPFAVLVPEDVIQARPPCLAQMMAVYQRTGVNLVAVAPVTRERPTRYGVITATCREDRLIIASDVAAQIAPGKLASDSAVVGRFIFDPTFIGLLDGPRSGTAGDIQFTDALAGAAAGGALHGYAFAGRHFDCSEPLGLLDANIAFTLARADLAPAARRVLARHTRSADSAHRANPVETPGVTVSA